jgi:hypothetical protein
LVPQFGAGGGRNNKNGLLIDLRQVFSAVVRFFFDYIEPQIPSLIFPFRFRFAAPTTTGDFK